MADVELPGYNIFIPNFYYTKIHHSSELMPSSFVELQVVRLVRYRSPTEEEFLDRAVEGARNVYEAIESKGRSPDEFALPVDEIKKLTERDEKSLEYLKSVSPVEFFEKPKDYFYLRSSVVAHVQLSEIWNRSLRVEDFESVFDNMMKYLGRDKWTFALSLERGLLPDYSKINQMLEKRTLHNDFLKFTGPLRLYDDCIDHVDLIYNSLGSQELISSLRDLSGDFLDQAVSMAIEYHAISLNQQPSGFGSLTGALIEEGEEPLLPPKLNPALFKKHPFSVN